MATKDGDPYVLNVQQWVNNTYRGKTGYTEIPENGKTGWTTIYALLHALQIELGITATADNFGTGTINAFNRDYPNGVKQQDDDDTTKKNIYGIIQGALLCKGYSIGASTPTCNFYGGTGDAIKSLKADAGLTDTTSTVTLNIMKALMSMDYFYSYDTSERTQNIISMQRYLNRNYEDYIGLCPCDGVYGRRTSKALIYAVQAEEKMPTSVANGNCGPATKNALPSIMSNGQYSGTSYLGGSYSSSDINKFKTLANIGLYFNGFGNGEVSSSLNTSAINSFQSKYAIPVNGNIDYTTWLSLLVSCGDQNRSAVACDCITKITNNNVEVLKNNGYQYVGRYMKNFPGGTLDKEISSEELKVVFGNGLRMFLIQQGGASYLEYFTEANAMNEVALAINAANNLQLQFGAIIYFAVDYDAQDAEIDNVIIPYFRKIVQSVMFSGKGQYRVGVYGTRNVCTKVCEAGLACSSFVSDMSTGYSGNLGFSIPDNWAFDQFATVTISSNGKSIEIDKDGFSGNYKGISQEYSATKEYFGEEWTTGKTTRLLINLTNSSVPVYKYKKHTGEASTPDRIASGEIIGYIKPNDFYLRYGVPDTFYDNVHKVMFNDGVDVKVGYITEQYHFSDMDATDDDIIDDDIKQILPGHEPFTCCNYNPSTGKYTLHDWPGNQEFTINQPVPYFNPDGTYGGMLNKGDKIKINSENAFQTGASRPWCNFVDEIVKTNGTKIYDCFVSSGIEYGNGKNRAWY